MNDQDWSYTLHASWTGIVLTVVGLIMFVVLAFTLLLARGPGIVTGAFATAAAISCLVVLRDMPIATEFAAHGITRRTPGRRHHIAWSDVSRVERVRSGIVRTRNQRHSGGLAARVGPRRFALTDRMESATEFDLLRDALGHSRADSLGLSAAIRPASGKTPTWQYRRARWHSS